MTVSSLEHSLSTDTYMQFNCNLSDQLYWGTCFQASRYFIEYCRLQARGIAAGGGVVGSWLSTFHFLVSNNFFQNFANIQLNYSGIAPPPATFHDSELSFFSFLFFWLVKIFLNEVAPPAPPQIFKKDATCLNLNMNNNTDAYVYMQ